MPQLKTLKIEHYKGFFREETIEFAVPDRKTPGSGLTLIVGPNNAGKTTVIESLLLNESENEIVGLGEIGKKRFRSAERHLKHSPRITINDCVYSNIDQGSMIRRVDGSQPHGIRFEIVQSRRYWDYQSHTSYDHETFLRRTSELETRGTAISSETANALKHINEDATRKNELNKLMKRIVPHFTDWTIDTGDQDYVKYRTANSEHQANLLGEGVMSVFRLCIHLESGDRKRVLVIDEPELSLHPTAQKSLSLILSEKSKNKQIILCTHSPYFVNWEDFSSGAHFIRLNKIKDEKCTVSRLQENKRYFSFIRDHLDEWQKPQLLDTVAKEVLFADRVLFVEGQEDVGLIRKWAADRKIPLKFDIFGYGVGGFRNISHFLQMARDLEIAKVGALYDLGTDVDESFKEDKKTFAEFLLQKLPTGDIRDKKPKKDCKEGCTCAKSLKVGCFDKKGNLKKEHTEAFNNIMDKFIKFFASP